MLLLGFIVVVFFFFLSKIFSFLTGLSSLLGPLGFWHLALPVGVCSLECNNNNNNNNIGLAMFCKQRSFGTPRTVHHTKSCLKLSFYRSIRIYRVDFEKI